MQRTLSLSLLALLGFAALPHSASAQLLGSTVTGTLRGSISPLSVVNPNLFDPTYGHVPVGYTNKTSGPTVTVAEPAIEFGYADSLNTITVNVTDTQVILSDTTNIGSGGYTVTLNDSLFNNLVKVSDSFAGGVSATRNGSLITINVPSFFYISSLSSTAFTPTATFNVVKSAAVPEPGTIALLASMGLSGAGLLVRRRKTAHKSA